MSNLTTAYGGNETLIENPYLCTLQTCDLSLASFSYLPSLPGNALYLAIFLLLFIAHAVLGSIYRTWGFLVALLFGLVRTSSTILYISYFATDSFSNGQALEIVGYLGRIMYHNNPFNDNNFLIYLVCVTIAPAFLTAGIYLCLARIVTVYGAQFSRFRPRTYTLIFCTFDFFSLVLQGLGGGIASTANSHSGSNLGKNIMIAGLAFQVVSLLIFGLCCGEFAMRLRANPAGWNAKYPALVHSTRFKSFLWGEQSPNPPPPPHQNKH